MININIRGEKRLEGSVSIGGAKNAAVAILPAVLATGSTCIINNLPDIKDVINLTKALGHIGAECKFIDSKTLSINASTANNFILDEASSKSTRASCYFMGALLARFGEAEVPFPGGCDFGVRPLDYHLKAFEALGAVCDQRHGIIKIKADKLRGANIYLDNPSVGATINIMIAAVFAEGTSIVENAAKEPHIVDCASFLNKMGAKIRGAGTDTIRITGVENLHGGEYTVVPDPIETGTYMIASAITGGDVTVENVVPKHMESLTSKLREMGCTVEEGDDWIRVIGTDNLKSCEVRTGFYPGFPTDLQPQMATLLCKAKNGGILVENVWNSRFRYTSELKRLGANIKQENTALIIKGSDFSGARVIAPDLRGGAALILAGLAAKGETVVGGVEFIDRGYENFVGKFRAIGADMERVIIDD